MKKLLKLHDAYTLKVLVAFLIVFTALYPKLPSIHIMRTWVYIRLEDFFILATVIIWVIQLIRKKATLPKWIGGAIASYWLVGLVSVIFSIIFIGPYLSNFFPHIAILNYLRRIEYMILFFVAFSAVKSVKDIKQFFVILSVTVFSVIIYGLGQRYYLSLWAKFPEFFEKYSFCFPSFQTGNEEFAKGIPLCLPEGARITSTFGGHYDLAAYLVIVLPIFLAVFISLKQWWWKVMTGLLFVSGLVLLIVTASRVSFGMYLVGAIATLVLYKKKWYILPVLLISFVLLVSLSNSTAQRFLSTIRLSSIVTDSQGQIVGELSPDLQNKISKTDGSVAIQKPQPIQKLPPGSAFIGVPEKRVATSSAVTTKALTPEETRRLQLATGSLQLSEVSGNFTVKQALVYDISFTTRFQSEWPNAWNAFMRNPLLGSGYSTITLATDNDYLRALGETGMLGLFTFAFIFIILGITFRSLIPQIHDPLLRGFIFGLAGGTLGLIGNAILIDVFEASKVAENLWLLLGIGVGGLYVATHEKVSYLPRIKKVLTSGTFMLVSLFFILAIAFSGSVNNFFVADDFTWLYWSANATFSDMVKYFTDSQNFFYRPLVKSMMVVFYNFFAFNPSGYHIITLFAHFLAVVGAYLLSRKLVKDKFICLIIAFVFLLHSAHSENLYGIATLPMTISTVFILYAVNSFINFRQKKNYWRVYFYLITFILSILAFLSYEIAIVIPFLLIAVDIYIIKPQRNWKTMIAHIPFILLWPIYGVVRMVTNTFNGGGNYSYSLEHFIPNVLGNGFGYLGLFVGGHTFLPIYNQLRSSLREEMVTFSLIAVCAAVFIAFIIFLFRKELRHFVANSSGRLIIFGLVFGFISLLPYLALGNISVSYVYLASFGFTLSFIVLLQSLVQRIFPNKNKSMIILIVIVMIFGGFYQYENIQQNEKWRKAGEITKTTLSLFRTDYPTLTPAANLYFVQLPVRYDGVWVFPVGIKDGLWFIYGSQLPNIHQVGSKQDAFDAINKTKTQQNYIFEFDKNGMIKEVKQ